ncbi:4519_t:CDS:2 [Dentiscutata heterogama]|uniref:4519_t:CDS:1 n=1 Tax=Dentiscutata heterogama TaxID=1316150 RepID=A0ACA9L840_9GLOM|nr:4519_t:CDS:2 [Dentiscutata heterogama]
MKSLFKNDKNEQTRSHTSNPEEDGKSKPSVMSKLKSLRKKKDSNGELVDRRSITEKNLDESFITKDDYAKSINSNHRQSVISINGNNRVSVADYDSLVKELEKANNEKESIKQQAEKAKEELERRDSDIKSLKDELRNSKEFAEKLQKDNSLPTTPDRQSHDLSLAVDNALQQEVDRLKNELQQKDNVIEQLNSKLANSNDINSKAEKFQFELEEKVQLIKKLNAELQDRDDTVQRMSSELNSNKQEIENIKKDALEKSKSMTSETENTKVALEVNKHEIANLKAELEQRNTIIQQLTSDLNTRNSALEKAQATLKSSDELSTNLKSEVDRLTSDLELIKNGSKGKVDLSEFEKCKNDLNSCQNEIIKLNAVIEEAQHSLAMKNEDYVSVSNNLEKSLASLRESNEEVVKLKSQFEKTQNNLKSNIEEISRLKSDIQERDQIIQELRDNLVSSKQASESKITAERDSLKKELQKIKADYQNRSNELQQVNIALQAASTEKQVVIEQRNQLKAELESARTSIHKIKRDLEQNYSDLQEVKNQLNERDQKINQQSSLIQSMVSKDKFDSINKAYNEIKSELENTKSELELKRNLLADGSSVDVDELRAQLSNAKAELGAKEWEKKQREDAKSRQQLEHKVQELMNENERVRLENISLSESERQARQLIESMAKKPKSPTINVIPSETTSTNNSNELISERSIEPSSSKPATIFEVPSPKRNSAIEPLDTNGVATIPQANVRDQKKVVPEISKNGVIPRPKKDDGNDGWITVKRRSMRQRNSMVMA